MTETPELTIYEKAFAKSDKTDAVLVIDGKKLHVNKAKPMRKNFSNSLINSFSQMQNATWNCTSEHRKCPPGEASIGR
ncbi:hypothetical protein CAEBREN_13821 [Caenorhabditis brenneri]|uniref:BTB domain-containing protein n=1 Tax=Caenorhabditis brenneri TaxID=135651 RepID=G0MVX9_CAEBE|nr:hypothetical protein CAEBREN_13821 [Caenorhabditis brenneri]